MRAARFDGGDLLPFILRDEVLYGWIIAKAEQGEHTQLSACSRRVNTYSFGYWL